MEGRRYHFVALFMLLAWHTVATGRENGELSMPLNLPLEGWNKVLCMKNGNTVLFHFEREKNILVKVFDSTHKEIASRKDQCHYLDILVLEYAIIKGVYDINGEAVMFVDQERMTRHCLFRLRFNASTGQLIEEKLVAESESASKRMRFYVMKNIDSDDYEIFFCTDRHVLVKRSDLFIVYFNKFHQPLHEIQLDIDRKKFDYLSVIGAEDRHGDVLVTLGLDKITQFGRPDRGLPLIEGGNVYQHYLSYYYLPKGDTMPHHWLADVSEGVFPLYSLFAPNPFAQSLNSLVFSYRPYDYQLGLNIVTGSITSDHLIELNTVDRSVGFKRITDSFANADLRATTDSLAVYEGVPLKLFTNNNGLSTLVSEAESTHGEPENRIRYNFEDYIGNIGITQFDDDGNEIWGTVLPLSQYYRSHRFYYTVKGLSKKWQEQVLFVDDVPEVYNRQFLSANIYEHDRSFYIIFNDDEKNFHRVQPGGRSDTVYNFEETNACYYRISPKREVTREHLYGDPAAREFKSSLIEGADYDGKRNVYASLVQYRKAGRSRLYMSWCHLE